MAVGYGRSVATSIDGVNWVARSIAPKVAFVSDVVFLPWAQTFIVSAVSEDRRPLISLFASSDSVNWNIAPGSSVQTYDIKYSKLIKSNLLRQILVFTSYGLFEAAAGELKVCNFTRPGTLTCVSTGLPVVCKPDPYFGWGSYMMFQGSSNNFSF